ncbi:VacJ family lipoprotein [Gammaproteobacteria bacterium]|nr:VacJ family lipoprotein [Gammaproteobacteria bacterium]MDA9567930.1 VacJ family lipoprotein [Gammaproteobacteria bacterium]MDA9579019.1 VacJ family lipoprotein [Gammaproteobacteria bacterium]
MLSCASSGPDPFEGFNRKMASFNTGFDIVVLKPAAQAYSKVLPAPVQTSVSNAFANLADPWTAMNQLLQGRVKLAASDTGRFVVNSTVGIAGLFDVATPMGMPRHQEDIEQTLGVWGVPQGPYIVLPMLGPSSGRGLVSQYFGIFGQDIAQPLRYVSNVPVRNSLFFTQLVSMRSGLLAMPAIPPQMDRYTLMRDFYLRGREQQVGL